jgi:cysteine desulfurase/selenocysteine lyase
MAEGAVTQSYPVEAIRRDFPILSREVHGRPLVYLDNGASAQKPQVVLDAIASAYGETYANVHRGLHFLSNASTDLYEEARRKVQHFLGAAHEEEIIFTRSSTEAINLVAHGLGQDMKEGDEIILSIMEHHSNIVPWHFLREKKGVVIKWAPVDDQGNFLAEEFEKLITPRTRLVAITHMSNVLGTVVPIQEICRLTHAHNVRVLVDGSQAAVHMPVNVQELEADFYCFTGHKLYGPSGIGVLYGKRDLLEAMPPFMGGGEMIETVSETSVTYAELPGKFEAGTPPIVQAIGLGAAIDYVQSLSREAIAAHEANLATFAGECLSALPFIRLIGTAEGKGAIFSFEMNGVHAHDVATILDRSGIAVRAGTHCAMPLLKRFGCTSSCRASFGLYNTREEVDALVKGLEKAHMFFE